MKENENIYNKERQQKIFELLKSRRRVSVKELVNEFKVSGVSIRNDLNVLAKNEAIVRTHGGAIYVENFKKQEVVYPQHKKAEIEGFKFIEALSKTIQKGDVVFVDSNFPLLPIFQVLSQKEAITVITNKLDLALKLVNATNLYVIMLGGWVHNEKLTSQADSFASMLEGYNISKALFYPYGFSLKAGLTDNEPSEITLKKQVAENAHSIICVVNDAGFDAVSLGTYVQPERISLIIANHVPKNYLEYIQLQGIPLICTEVPDESSLSQEVLKRGAENSEDLNLSSEILFNTDLAADSREGQSILNNGEKIEAESFSSSEENIYKGAQARAFLNKSSEIADGNASGNMLSRKKLSFVNNKMHDSCYSSYIFYRKFAAAKKTYPEQPGKNRKIGFANGFREGAFCAGVEESIVEQALLAGFAKEDIIIYDNAYDPERALVNADKIFESQPDVFIEFQTDSKTNNIIASKFRGRNIPILALEVPIPGSVYVGVDNWNSAILTGNEAVKLVKKKWKKWNFVDLVVILQMTEAGEATMLRSEGFVEALENEYGDAVEEKILRLNISNGNAETVSKAVDTLIEEYGDAENLLMTSMTERGMREVIAELKHRNLWDNLNKIIVTNGCDRLTVDYIRDGTIDISIAHFPEHYGEYVVPAACSIMQGDSAPAYIFVENKVITRDNIDLYYPLD